MRLPQQGEGEALCLGGGPTGSNPSCPSCLPKGYNSAGTSGEKRQRDPGVGVGAGAQTLTLFPVFYTHLILSTIL